ncbi:gcn5-like 1 [Trichoderma arundinaceum]|uniref:Biogenesis of lysosome-related organelles complex 1 subunit 1 n=1 Tax=Trichoderma arundinaceum TaxID=490622 RepID=A0A395NAP5_TRIAR|nr:gcn5-like 1 [Trichoderma arundinaceum]
MSAASSSGLRRTANANSTSSIAGPSSSSSPRWFSSHAAASPPTSTPISAPSVATTSAAATASPALQPTLPSTETQRHIAEARAAVVASIGNMLDSELQSRAGILHENAAALEKQERDVLRATEGLRKETQKLKTEADKAARKVKELGNVQNWAEVLERGFLVLEETVRLANGGEDTDEDGGSEGSCSCSECGRGSGGSDEEGEDNVNGINDHADDGAGGRMEVDTMSDASRSLMELDSSTGTGRAKGSETASISTG